MTARDLDKFAPPRLQSKFSLMTEFRPRTVVNDNERNQVVGVPRTKGNTINGALDFAKEKHPEAWPRISEKIQPLLAALPGGRALAGSWYDLAIFSGIVETMCSEIAGDPQKVSFDWGAYTLERDMKGGIYRAFLRLTPPHLMFRLFGRIWSLYQDSGRVAVLGEADGAGRIICYGLATPSYLVWYGTVGACCKILQLSGTQNVQHKITAGGQPGSKFIEFELSWT
jgi:hypothetical protein